jgi:hypothetical protein
MKPHYSSDEIISIITYSGVNIDGERYYMNEDEFGNTLFQAKLSHYDNEAVSVQHNETGIIFDIFLVHFIYGYEIKAYFKVNEDFNYTHLYLWNNHLSADANILAPAVFTKAIGLPNQDSNFIVLEGVLPCVHRNEWNQPEVFNVYTEIMLFNFVYAFANEAKNFLSHLEHTEEYFDIT